MGSRIWILILSAVLVGPYECYSKVLPCTHKGQSLPPGKPFWDGSDCTELCECDASTGLVSCQKSQCKPEEECKVIEGVSDCVAKPIPSPAKAQKVLPCTHKGQSHPPGTPFWDGSDCTELCDCNPSTGLVSCQKSQCKPEEECKVVEGVSECVAKAIPKTVIPEKVLRCTHKAQSLGKIFWADSACTEICECNSSTGDVNCQKSQCKAGEKCKLVGTVRPCNALSKRTANYHYTYITVFMFNAKKEEEGKNQLFITSYLSDTHVLVTVSKSQFRQRLTIEWEKSVMVELPTDTELKGSGKYSKTVIIRSSKFITIVSSNQRKNSVETSLVYPVSKFGQEYYVFTPPASGYPKELAVFGSQVSTSVTVELKCTVTFEGKTYKPDEKLTAYVCASEVLYLESDEDCTGSRVVSDKPVGVISGHACASINSNCQHTFEQLLPVEYWGTSFIVAPFEFPILVDSVFVFASQVTKFTYTFGPKSQIVVIKAGQWKEIPMGQNPPLSISSDQPIQVLYYCNGGKFSDGSVFDPFIMNIVPNRQFCESHSLEGMEGFTNYALIIAKTKDINTVQLDDKPPSFNWQEVHDTEYSWAHFTYEAGRGHHTIKSPCAAIGVYSVGKMDQNSYGAPAACGLLTCHHYGQYHPPGKPFWKDTGCTKLCECDPSTGVISCQKSQCKPEEECKVVKGVSGCVAKTIPALATPLEVLPCTHKGQSHPPGKHFWDGSDCTELCDCNPSTGLVSCQKSQCKPEEECKVVKGVSECVAKTIPTPVKTPTALPCTHKGQSLPPGKPFWDGSDCTELCECNPSTGLVSCQKSQCKPEEECKVVEGVSECVAKTIPKPAIPQKVGCSLKGQAHSVGKPFSADSACTGICECNSSTDDVNCLKSQCKAGEKCKLVGTVRPCYTLSKHTANYHYTYITVFMFNANAEEKGKNQLFITAYLSNTRVLVTVNKYLFKQRLTIEWGKSVMVELPSDTELKGTGKYSKTVIIRSSKFITIVSSNQKKNSVETSLVYPVSKFGQEYYVFTPPSSGYPKELAVFGSQVSTSVTVELKCTVTFEGKTYKPDEKLTAYVCASEVLYLESDEDCTGSRVVSDKPVGVISGHACASINSNCQHTFEQLLPVEHWGTSFIVAPLEYQNEEDSVFVFASQVTKFTYTFGPKSQIAVIKAGQWKEIPMGRNPPLGISSDQPIQVLYYCNGGKFSDGSVFDPFIMNIVPNQQFCESHSLEGMEGFTNYALIIAKTEDIKKVQFDDEPPSFNWQEVHDTEYSWAHYTYEGGRGHHTMKSPCAAIGVYSVGTMDQNSYGAPAACGLLTCHHYGQYHPPGKQFWKDSGCTKLCECDASTGVVSCQKSQCKPEEECKVVEGVGDCVAKTIPALVKPLEVLPCTHKGQSHPPGKPFWDGSDCTELCDCNPSTGLVSCQKSQCKPEEECKVVKDVSECVAKTITAPIKAQKVLPCTHKGQSHPPGKPFWDGSDCTELCECNPSTGLVSCQKSQCKPEKECQVINGVGDCVAKTIPDPVKPQKVLPCTHKGQSHPPGKPFWDGSDCTKLCECNPSTGLVSCQKSQCKPEEECQVIKGVGDCVGKTIPEPIKPQKVLPCTHKGQSLPPGKPFWDGSDCTKLCECNPSTALVTCQKSQCKPEEECQVIKGVGACVAKTIPDPVKRQKVLPCTHKGQSHPPGKPFWDGSDCTELCECNPSTGLVTCQKSQCKPEEECKVIKGVGDCVAKTIPDPVKPQKVLPCTHKGQSRPPGKSFWDGSDCTELCDCNPSTGLVTCQKSQCKPEEECQVIKGVGDCVAKTIPDPVKPQKVGKCPGENPNCDCVHQGKQIKFGEAWQPADCSERCVCLAGGWVRCEGAGCAPGESCVERDGAWRCEGAPLEATCHLLPSGGFHSFDGLEDRLWMEGTYSLALPTAGAQLAFGIAAHLSLFACEPSVTFTDLFYKDLTVEVKKDLTTVVDGKAVSLPFRTDSGLEIVESRDGVVVRHATGLLVQYCGSGTLSLTLPAAFGGKTAGLCGNFNGRADDDLRLRDGSAADDFAAFYRDWRV